MGIDLTHSKVLLFTHDLTTSFDAKKALDEIAKNEKTTVNWFELSQEKLAPFRRTRSEYAQLLSAIYNFALGDATDDISIGNKMRRTLEAFSTFCYKKGIEQVSQDSDILDSLGNRADYFENRMYRLVLHGESHFEEQIYNMHDAENFFQFFSVSEKINIARDILCFMYSLNSLHILAYLPNSKETIQRWLEEIDKKHISSPSILAFPNPKEKKTIRLYELPASAGVGISMLDDSTYTDYETDVATCDFAIRISGDSMEPRIANHSIALVHKQETIEPNEVGIFQLNGEVFCKRFEIRNMQRFLISLNPKYAPIKIREHDSFTCFGKVIDISNQT